MSKASTPWLEDIEKPDYPKLDRDISVDVAIIGAGIAGSIAAYLLAKEGKSVALIDKKDIYPARLADGLLWK